MSCAEFVAAALVFLAAATTQALPADRVCARTGVIDGVVSDTGLVPLEGATISIVGLPVRVVTNARGHFRVFGVKEGEYLLVVTRRGFEGVTAKIVLEPEEAARISIALNPVTGQRPQVEIYSRPAVSPD